MLGSAPLYGAVLCHVVFVWLDGRRLHVQQQQWEYSFVLAHHSRLWSGHHHHNKLPTNTEQTAGGHFPHHNTPSIKHTCHHYLAQTPTKRETKAISIVIMHTQSTSSFFQSFQHTKTIELQFQATTTQRRRKQQKLPWPAGILNKWISR